MGNGVFGQPTLLNTIKDRKYMQPNTIFHPDKNLAEGFHLEIANPEPNNPMALEAVPI